VDSLVVRTVTEIPVMSEPVALSFRAVAVLMEAGYGFSYSETHSQEYQHLPLMHGHRHVPNGATITFIRLSGMGHDHTH